MLIRVRGKFEKKRRRKKRRLGGPGLVSLDPGRNSVQNRGIGAPRALMAAPFMAKIMLKIMN